MPKPGAAITHPLLTDAARLHRAYIKDGRSCADIAAEAGCATVSVNRWLRRHGIPVRRPGGAKTPTIDIDPVWLRKRYMEDQLRVAEIAEEVGCTPGSIYRYLRRYGLPVGPPCALPDDRERPASLYRFYGEEGHLLYVGVTCQGRARWEAHERLQPWWHRVACATIEHYPSRSAALDAEAAAIREESPECNRAT